MEKLLSGNLPFVLIEKLEIELSVKCIFRIVGDIRSASKRLTRYSRPSTKNKKSFPYSSNGICEIVVVLSEIVLKLFI